jgi:hypothetical protein
MILNGDKGVAVDQRKVAERWCRDYVFQMKRERTRGYALLSLNVSL